MVDCSHANSRKDPARQTAVLEDVIDQLEQGCRSLIGVMIESHLEAGNQPLPKDPAQLRYGVSITDGCIDWDTTARCLKSAAERLRRLRALHKAG
jgi:3-deoxy-7-phosphoheptulonate synthase